MKKTAVVLMNLGGPGSFSEIQPFLFSLFFDPAIINLPLPIRWMVAKLISSRRAPEAEKIYSYLEGKSPLLSNTKAQAEALEARLGLGYKVFIVMRHAFPRANDVVPEVQAYEPDEIVLLPLYPQLSSTTSTSSIQDWSRAYKHETSTREVCCYPTELGFIEAYADLIRSSYQKAMPFGKPLVLLTAHGLPKKIIRKGDPYQFQVEKTAHSLRSLLSVDEEDIIVCYQSRVGPLKWIEPYTDDEIISASQDGRPVVVAPISFVSEHSETLVELDIEYKELAAKHGCPFYERVPAVGTHPKFIDALVNMVKQPNPKERICPESFKLCPCATSQPEESRVA